MSVAYPVCVFKSSGIVRAGESRLAAHWWVWLECCDELARYYRYLCLKHTCRYARMMTPAWGAHITLVRREFVETEKVLLHQGREMEFRYDHKLVTNDKHLWLAVECNEIEELRLALGLPAEPLFPPHLTVAVMPGGEHAVLPVRSRPAEA